jgi:hypothetical protein
MAARLASGVLPPTPLPRDVRAVRAAGAQTWFAAHALPPRLLSALLRLATASAQDEPVALAAALHEVADSATGRLDDGSRSELARLAHALTETPAPEEAG